MHVVIAKLDAAAAGTFADLRRKRVRGREREGGGKREGEREGKRGKETVLHSPPDYAGAQDKLVNSNQLN